jgi:hypothetical protein
VRNSISSWSLKFELQTVKAMITYGTAVGIRSSENKCGLGVATPKKQKKEKRRTTSLESPVIFAL